MSTFTDLSVPSQTFTDESHPSSSFEDTSNTVSSFTDESIGTSVSSTLYDNADIPYNDPLILYEGKKILNTYTDSSEVTNSFSDIIYV